MFHLRSSLAKALTSIISSGGVLPAFADFASRIQWSRQIENYCSEEVIAVIVGDALLALVAKSGRVSAYNGPSSTLTLNNPFGKRGWAIYFYAQFYPTPTSRAKSTTSECLQVARQRCLDRAHNGQLIIVSFCGSE